VLEGEMKGNRLLLRHSLRFSFNSVFVVQAEHQSAEAKEKEAKVVYAQAQKELLAVQVCEKRKRGVTRE